MLRNKCLYGLALVAAAILTVNAYSATKNGHRSSAHMDGKNDMCANAQFEQVTVKGKVCKKLMIMLDHAKPNTTYNVFVNDEKVGTIGTNQKGKGKLDLRNASFMTSDSKRMRNGFPMLHKGDCVRVGPLTGVFVDEDDGSDDGGGTPPGGDPAPVPVPTGYQVQGELTGYGSSYGTVTYTEKTESGVFNRSFEVTYDDAIPMHLLFVMINNDVWLNLMTDANGHAHFMMQTNPPADSTDISPMMDGFPSIHADDVVMVGYGTATMVQTATYGGDVPPAPPVPPAPGTGTPCDNGSVGDGSDGDGEHGNHESSHGEHHDNGNHYANGHNK